jgi:hypothetical protein
VPLPREKEQQGVSAELEHVAALALGDPDQALEDPGNEEDELLGAGPALGLEPLRKASESGKI